MAINYPGSLDDFTNPAAGNTLDSPSHSGQHSDLNDAVEALEAKVGIGASPAGSATAGQVLTAQGGGTAIWETLPISGGLIPLHTEIFTSAATVSIDNVFSSTYKNYMVIFNLTGSSASSAEMRFRLRASATDTTTGYNGANKFMAHNTTTTFDVATSPTDRWNMGYIPNAGDGRFAGYANVFNPESSTIVTTFQGMATGTNTGAYRGFGISSGTMNSAATVDGFTVYPTAGNLTGIILVFGYKE